MKNKNKEIQSMIGLFKADLKANINPLSMLLNGVIDAAVMGGISNYEKVIFGKSVSWGLSSLIMWSTCDQHNSWIDPASQRVEFHDKTKELGASNPNELSFRINH